MKVQQAERDLMVRLYRSGHQVPRIALALDRHRVTVCKVLIAAGVYVPKPGGTEPKMPVRPASWHPDIPDAEECRERVARLTPRQREVLDLIAHGFTSQESARRMGVAMSTFHNTLGAAMDVLEVRPPRVAVALLTRAQTEVAPRFSLVEGSRLAS